MDEASTLAKPLVSVIILNYNGKNFIKRCLQTVLADSYEPKEVILVDNASQDDSMDMAEDFADQIRIIRNSENYGFPKGCNVGIRQAKGDIIVLLNIDTAVRPHWLNELIKPMILNPRIGITGSKLFFLDGKRIQYAGGGIKPNCLTYHDGYGQPDAPEYNVIKDAEYITGASVAIRRELLEKAGGLDEGFPMYFEDVDLSFTARRLGYRVRYQPTSVVLHFETFGTPKNSAIYYFKYHRGRIRFLLKHFGARYFLTTFIPAELKWYTKCGLRQQFIPLMKAYATQLPKAPYFWLRGFLDRRRPVSFNEPKKTPNDMDPDWEE